MKTKAISILFGLLLFCCSCVEENWKPDDVELNITSFFKSYSIDFDLDQDGEFDIRITAGGHSSNFQPAGDSYNGISFHNEDTYAYTIAATAYVCNDTIINYDDSGYNGSRSYMCDSQADNIRDVIAYDHVEVLASVDNLDLEEMPFRNDVDLIRESEWFSINNPYPDFHNYNYKYGSEHYATGALGYFVLLKDGVYYAIEYEQVEWDIVFYRSFVIC